MFAHHFGRDALGYLAEAATIQRQAELGMGVHVDETRRDDPPCGINHPLGLDRSTANISDGIAFDCDVLLHPGASGAVDHMAILDQDISLGRRRVLRLHHRHTEKKQNAQHGRAAKDLLPLNQSHFALPY